MLLFRSEFSQSEGLERLDRVATVSVFKKVLLQFGKTLNIWLAHSNNQKLELFQPSKAILA